MRKVTLKDIAEELGVTVPTVSSALSNTGRVSSKMRSRVKEAADRLGYHPNLAAKLLKSKYIDSIGLVINNDPQHIYGSGLFEPLMFDFIQACSKADINYQVEVCNMLSDTDRLPKLMTSGVVGGILYGGYISPQVREWQKGPHRLPMVTLDEYSDYCVINDYCNGVKQAIQYLAALGHKKIFFTSGPTCFHVHAQAKEEMLNAAKEFALDFDPENDIAELDISDDKENAVNVALSHFRTVFKKEAVPTALFCSSGAPGARAAIFAAQEAGLKVPEDISIICISAPFEAKGSCPPLSSIASDSESMISSGINLLNSLIKGHKQDLNNVLVPAKFEIRATTAKAKMNRGRDE